MQSIRPRTYNEIMLYKRCLELKRLVPEIDEQLFVRIYQHMQQSRENRVGLSDGKLVFYEDENAMETLAIAAGAAFRSIHLSAVALDIERPGSYGDHSSGGIGSNNNNNNNNNNNA